MPPTRVKTPFSELDTMLLDDSSMSSEPPEPTTPNQKSHATPRSSMRMNAVLFRILLASMATNLVIVFMLFKYHLGYKDAVFRSPAILLLGGIGCGIVWSILELSALNRSSAEEGLPKVDMHATCLGEPQIQQSKPLALVLSSIVLIVHTAWLSFTVCELIAGMLSKDSVSLTSHNEDTLYYITFVATTVTCFVMIVLQLIGPKVLVSVVVSSLPHPSLAQLPVVLRLKATKAGVIEDCSLDLDDVDYY